MFPEPAPIQLTLVCRRGGDSRLAVGVSSSLISACSVLSDGNTHTSGTLHFPGRVRYSEGRGRDKRFPAHKLGTRTEWHRMNGGPPRQRKEKVAMIIKISFIHHPTSLDTHTQTSSYHPFTPLIHSLSSHPFLHPSLTPLSAHQNLPMHSLVRLCITTIHDSIDGV